MTVSSRVPDTILPLSTGNFQPGDVVHEHASHHRYAIWWTGDGVPLEGSIESMVDAGVHDMKAYLHSDCGGDYRGSSGDLLRWTGHCTFGSIFRYHGNAHQPWSYDNHTEDVIRDYLNLRCDALFGVGKVDAGASLLRRGLWRRGLWRRCLRRRGLWRLGVMSACAWLNDFALARNATGTRCSRA